MNAQKISTREVSLEARESIEPSLARVKALVLDLIERAGPRGITCDEIEIASGLTHQTASARVNELMRAGSITASGRRLTRSGRRAITWTATRTAPKSESTAGA